MMDEAERNNNEEAVEEVEDAEEEIGSSKPLGVFSVEEFPNRQAQNAYLRRFSNTYMADPSRTPDKSMPSIRALDLVKDTMRKNGIARKRDLFGLRGQMAGERSNCPCQTITVLWQHPTKKVIVITTTEADSQMYALSGWERMTHFYYHSGDDAASFDDIVAGAVEDAQVRVDVSVSAGRGASTPLGGRESPDTKESISGFCHQKGFTDEFLDQFEVGTECILPVLQWSNTVVSRSNTTFLNILRDYIYFSSDDCDDDMSAVDRRSVVNGVKNQGTIIVRATAAARHA